MFKRGVSLYSFQEELFLGQMTLENCVAFCASIGAKGIEVLPEQNMPGFPNISDAQVDAWHAMMAKYDTIGTCYDMFLDTKLRKERLMTDEEQVASIVRDLKLANRLGIHNMRVLVFVRPDILERCIPYAEQYDVRMGVEVHAPWSLDHAWILRTIEVAERTGTKHLGVVLDMGVFMKHYPPVWRDRFIRQGANPETAAFIVDQHEKKIMAEYTIYDAAVTRRGNKFDIAMAEMLRHNPYSNPRRVKEFIPYIFHIHGKFYEMTDDCKDPSIAYDEVVPLLIEAGYEGYISSEYEGNRWIQDVQPVDSREQVRRQHVMLERLAKSSTKQLRG